MLGFEIEDDDERSNSSKVIGHSNASSPIRHVAPMDMDPSPPKEVKIAAAEAITVTTAYPTSTSTLYPSGIVKVKQKANKKEDEQILEMIPENTTNNRKEYFSLSAR